MYCSSDGAFFVYYVLVPAAEFFVIPIGIWLVKFGLIFEVLHL